MNNEGRVLATFGNRREDKQIGENGETKFLETPEDMSGMVDVLVKSGANIIGGCCGTTPEHIKEIARLSEKYEPRNFEVQ